jgi:hypothetical protein
MSIYNPSNDPASPNYSIFSYIDSHPPKAVVEARAAEAAKVEAAKQLEGNRILARLREQDRASTDETTFTNDILHAEQGFIVPEPLTVDEPVRVRRMR